MSYNSHFTWEEDFFECLQSTLVFMQLPPFEKRICPLAVSKTLLL